MNRKTTVRACPICQGTAAEVLHTQRFVLPEGYPLVEQYDVVACASCDCVYADVSVDQREYDAFYAASSKYQHSMTSSGAGDTPWDARRLETTARHIALMLPDRTARILDVGCANGGLLVSLQRLGFSQLLGLDPSPACVANTRARGIEAVAGWLTDPPQDMGQFDCVILSHMLEHVREVRSALRSAGALLRPGGCIYVEVPDATRYVDYLFCPFQEFNTERINHFSITCLANLLSWAGLRLEVAGRKLIEAAPEVPYPVIYGLAVRAKEPVGAVRWRRDRYLRRAVRAYISASQQLMRRIDHKLQAALRQSPQIILWGTGQLAMKLLAETCLAEADIVACVDSSPVHHGKRLRGVPIGPPEHIRDLPYPIVITSILHQAAITERIRSLGLFNPIVLLGELP